MKAIINKINEFGFTNVLFFLLITAVEFHFVDYYLAGYNIPLAKWIIAILVNYLLYKLREIMIIDMPVFWETEKYLLWGVNYFCLWTMHCLFFISLGIFAWQLSLNIESKAIASSAPVLQAEIQLKIEQTTLAQLTATQDRQELQATVANIPNIENDIAEQKRANSAKLSAFWNTQHANGMSYQSLASITNGRCKPIGNYATAGTQVCNAYSALMQQVGLSNVTDKLQHATASRATLSAIEKQELKVMEMEARLIELKSSPNSAASKSMGAFEMFAYWISGNVSTLSNSEIKITGQQTAAGVVFVLLSIVYIVFFSQIAIREERKRLRAQNNDSSHATPRATPQVVDNTSCNTFYSDDVQQFDSPMQQALQRDLRRVQQPFFDNFVAPKEKKTLSPTAIMVGTNESGEGERVYFDPMAGHTLIAGQSGGGKSTFSTNTLIFQIVEKFPKHIDLYLFDSKQTLPQYKGLTPSIKAACNDTEAIKFLSQIEKERQRRQNLFLEMGIIDNLSQYNIELVKQGKTPLPSILIIFDEYGIANKGVVRFVETIAKAGRSAGIFLLLMYQYDVSKKGKERLSSDLLANLPQKFCFKLDTNIQYSTVTGLQHSTIKDLIKGDIIPPYHCLAVIKSMNKPILLKPTLYIEDSRDKKIEWILKMNPNFNISQQPIDGAPISTPFERRADVDVDKVQEMRDAGYSMTDIAKMLSASRNTVYRRLNEGNQTFKEAGNEG